MHTHEEGLQRDQVGSLNPQHSFGLITACFAGVLGLPAARAG